MINFNKFSKTKEVTYTIIKRRYTKELQMALELAGETNWETRSCRVHDKSMLNDIKEHLPEWFDARYTVFISHFKSEDIHNMLNAIINDKDVKLALEHEEEMAYNEYLHSGALQ